MGESYDSSFPPTARSGACSTTQIFVELDLKNQQLRAQRNELFRVYQQLAGENYWLRKMLSQLQSTTTTREAAMKLADIQAAASVAEAKPQADLQDQVQMVFGGKSVGKSTYASRYKRPLFFDFEDRLRNITLPDGTRPAQLQFAKWDDVEAVTEALQGTTPEESGYDTLVFDGCGFAWNLLLLKLLKDNDVESWNDGALGYMKGRDIAVKRWSEWLGSVRALTRQGYGVIFTAHETVEPFEFNGQKIDRHVPLVSGVSGGVDWGWQSMRPFMDMVIYVSKKEVDGKPTVTMRLKGTQQIEAADPTPDARLPAETTFSFKNLKKFWDADPKAEAKAKKKAEADAASTAEGE